MHVCRVDLENAVSRALGSPFKPSVTAIKMSCTPLALSSLKTDSQNEALSVSSSQSPRMSFVPSARTASAMCMALGITAPEAERILMRIASKKTTGYMGSSGDSATH